MTRLSTATYNMQDLYRSDSTRDRERAEQLYRVIRKLRQRCDEYVLAVQEVVAPAEGGPAAFQHLADETGLLPGPCAPGHHVADGLYHWVGLLWTSGVELVEGSVREFGHEMWHNLVTASVRVHDRVLRVGSYHGAPHDQDRNVAEARRIVLVYGHPPHAAMPGWVGADWNALSGDRVEDADGAWPLYDTRDPYRSGWRPVPNVFQCRWGYDEHGHRHWENSQGKRS